MSIRNRILFSLLFTLTLAVAGIGLLGREGLEFYRHETTDRVQADLLHEGTESFIATVHQFCAVVENQPENETSDLLLQELSQYQLDDSSYQYFFYTPDGARLGDATDGGLLAEMAAASGLAAFYENAVKGGETELTVDNFESYLRGTADTPGIVHLHAYPARQLVLGMGQIQDVADIRLQSIADIGEATVSRLIRLGFLFYCLIALTTLFLAWCVLEYMFFRPLTRAFLHGDGKRDSGITWARFREYASRLQDLQQQMGEIRRRLERETEARFQAEEERDRLRNKIEGEKRDYEAKMESQYAEALQEAESEIMRREARMLYRQLKEPVEQAHATLATGGDGSRARELLEQCLTTVRGLADEDHELPHTPERMALQPWLENLVTQFGQDRNVAIQSNIENGMHVNIDPRSLRPAIEYILENALDVTPEGAAIGVDATRSDDHVEIRVVDRGTGIATAARPHILVPFYSLRPEGNGLGLAITRSVIRQHGGRLDFRSESRKGTAVIVSLPLASA